MTNVSSLWEILSSDVAFLGGPSSPMLSWLGVCGILLFFLLHVMKFKNEISSVQRGFERVHPMLVALAHKRGDVDRERFIPQAENHSASQRNRGIDSSMRSDCHDLQALDEAMNKEPMFRGPWAQYRRTLVLENVPWFMEPRLFSTRCAEEVLTQDALVANRVNLSFYGQFPALVTNIGLLLTFLALFVGLGRLHADGSEVVGIQGLINGLAGKFLTSIVGLMVANLFTFIEKPMVSRLMRAHHTFLGLIDQLFPRKTIEQILEQRTSIQGQHQGDPAKTSMPVSIPSSDWGMTGLAGPMASLTSSIQALTKLQEEAHMEVRRTMANVPGASRDELRSSLHELSETIHALTKILKDAPSTSPLESSASHRSFLWKASGKVLQSPGTNSSGKTTSWPRWPRVRRAG